MLVAIDPGKEAVGVARFVDGLLVECACVRKRWGEGPVQWAAMAAAVHDWIGDDDLDELAIELMVFRRNRPEVVNDLIELSQVSGGIYALADADNMIAVPPSDWTHNRPKKVNHRRIRKRLDKDETAALEYGLEGSYKSNHKEVLDAVGIGLHVLKRLG